MKAKYLFLLLLTATSLTACFGGKEASKTRIYVFAAASMTETLNLIKEQYESAHSDVELLMNFESSGTLQKQIEAGADCDVFISAAPKQMNALQEKGFIKEDSRFDLLENKVTLVVPNSNPMNVVDFLDLKERLLNHEEGFILAMGGPDVPVGQYTQNILKYFDLSEEDLNNNGMLSYGTNVKEVTTQVVQNSVACGIVYKTDAFSAKLTVKDEATPEMCGQVIYPAALTKKTQDEKASEFLSYLTSNSAKEVFESVGFTVHNQ